MAEPQPSVEASGPRTCPYYKAALRSWGWGYGAGPRQDMTSRVTVTDEHRREWVLHPKQYDELKADSIEVSIKALKFPMFF